MRNKKVLIIEDDSRLSKITLEFLKSNGYEAIEIEDFLDINEQIKEILPHLIVLDINLPYTDGYFICREIRSYLEVPILITSARDREVDQILALDIGADDYLVKPYSLQMLNSKVNALMRRVYGEYSKVDSKKEYCGLALDNVNYKVTYRDSVIEVSKNEMKLLNEFFNNPNVVIERSKLFEVLWDDDSFVEENALTVNISRIKNLFKGLGIENIIQTKRGVGYIFNLSSLEDKVEI